MPTQIIPWPYPTIEGQATNDPNAGGPDDNVQVEYLKFTDLTEFKADGYNHTEVYFYFMYVGINYLPSGYSVLFDCLYNDPDNPYHAVYAVDPKSLSYSQNSTQYKPSPVVPFKKGVPYKCIMKVVAPSGEVKQEKIVEGVTV